MKRLDWFGPKLPGHGVRALLPPRCSRRRVPTGGRLAGRAVRLPSTVPIDGHSALADRVVRRVLLGPPGCSAPLRRRGCRCSRPPRRSTSAAGRPPSRNSSVPCRGCSSVISAAARFMSSGPRCRLEGLSLLGSAAQRVVCCRAARRMIVGTTLASNRVLPPAAYTQSWSIPPCRPLHSTMLRPRSD